MSRVFQTLLFVLARRTRNALIRQVEWLKAEKEMLRKEREGHEPKKMGWPRTLESIRRMIVATDFASGKPAWDHLCDLRGP